jgi:hypothetical protein
MVKKLPTTATTDLGDWLNGLLVLYLGCFGKSENKALFNPKPLVARERNIFEK